jgi:hypothetical protein
MKSLLPLFLPLPGELAQSNYVSLPNRNPMVPILHLKLPAHQNKASLFAMALTCP